MCQHQPIFAMLIIQFEVNTCHFHSQLELETWLIRPSSWTRATPHLLVGNDFWRTKYISWPLLCSSSVYFRVLAFFLNGDRQAHLQQLPPPLQLSQLQLQFYQDEVTSWIIFQCFIFYNQYKSGSIFLWKSRPCRIQDWSCGLLSTWLSPYPLCRPPTITRTSSSPASSFSPTGLTRLTIFQLVSL